MSSEEIIQKDCSFNDVDVVVPCYKAAEWIDNFIETMLLVVEINWRLIVRDDDSNDSTLEKLRAWRDRLGTRILLLDDTNPKKLGLIGNYNAVLSASTSMWVFTADPDDVWLPQHVPLIMKAINLSETTWGINLPMAIGSDGVVVDAQLKPIADSYWMWSRILPRQNPKIPKIAMESAALGSTMAVNRALLSTALPLPPQAAYQDWWLAMVASAFGRLTLLDQPTILYRRHSINATNSPYSSSLVRGLLRFLTAPNVARHRLKFLINQAAKQSYEFHTRYHEKLSPKDNRALIDLSSIQKFGFVQRRLIIIKNELWFGYLLKNIGLMLLL